MSGREQGGDAARNACLVARVQGHVQGVGYRAFVIARAHALRLQGWVRNLPTGDVDLEAEGPREALESLLGALKTGPPAARVREVHAEWAPVRGHCGFEIKRI